MITDTRETTIFSTYRTNQTETKEGKERMYRWRGGFPERKEFLVHTIPSSQLPQSPKHTDCIERVCGTRTAADVLKVERPRNSNSTLFVILPLHFSRLGSRRVDRQPVITMIREVRQGSHRVDCAAPACARVKVLATATCVVFGWRCEACDPRMRERLFGCKAARGVWIGVWMKIFVVGCQSPKSETRIWKGAAPVCL